MNELKIAVIGEIATGKTALIKRLVTNEFTDDYSPTIGGELSTKTINIKGQDITCHLWDTTGEERFHSLCKIFYQNALIIYVVYDITNKASFEAIKNYWINELRENAAEDASNKADLYVNQEVTEQEGRDLANSIEGYFQLVSSKTGNGVSELFEESIKMYIDKHGFQQLRKETKQLDDNKKNTDETTKSKWNCSMI